MSIMWSPGVTLEQIEKQIIKSAIRHFKNRATTAEALGISLRTIDYRLEAYAKEEEEQRLLGEELDRKRQDFINRSRGIKTEPEVPAQVEAQAAAKKPEVQVTKLRSK